MGGNKGKQTLADFVYWLSSSGKWQSQIACKTSFWYNKDHRYHETYVTFFNYCSNIH